MQFLQRDGRTRARPGPLALGSQCEGVWLPLSCRQPEDDLPRDRNTWTAADDWVAEFASAADGYKREFVPAV